MGLPNNNQYIRGMALENATRLIASRLEEDFTIGSILTLADIFAEYIRTGEIDE